MKKDPIPKLVSVHPDNLLHTFLRWTKDTGFTEVLLLIFLYQGVSDIPM